MGRFLSGNVSDSFRRVQYLFRLYSLPHRAVGWKSRPRMRGQFLPRQTSGDTHTLSSQPPLLLLPVPSVQLLGKTPGKLANLTRPFFAQADLVFATHFAVDCACGARWKFLWWLLWKQWLQSAMPHPTSTKYKAPATWYKNAERSQSYIFYSIFYSIEKIMKVVFFFPFHQLG